jgi:hypothetical protein
VTDKKSIEDLIQELGNAGKHLRGISEEEREEKRRGALEGPVADPSAFLAVDPETQKRQVRYGVTAVSFQKIKFRVMTRADYRRVPTDDRLKGVPGWPDAAKVRIAASCLVEPDLGWPDDWREMPDEDLVTWADRKLTWAAVDDVVMEIWERSQPQFSLPEFRVADDEKGGSTSHPTPKTGSSTNGSTDSDIPIPSATA